MTQRSIPNATHPVPEGAMEVWLAFGARVLPGWLGYVCNRKLKRRLCNKSTDTFSEILADTGPGDLCIDLGANIGEITARLAASGAEVISFEPDPDTFAVLARNTADLPNVTLHQKAAGARAEQLMLRRSKRWDPSDPARHSAANSIVHDSGPMSDENSVPVEVVDFPAFLADLDRDIRILKIDIEGAEWDLLEGLLDSPVLSRIDCIFVETHERVDPARNIPRFNALNRRVIALDRPYINLFWV